VTELQVDALTARVGGNEELCITGKRLPRGNTHGHRLASIDQGNLVTHAFQQILERHLRSDELGEDQELGGRAALMPANLVNDIQQGHHLGIMLPLSASSQVEQRLNCFHFLRQFGPIHHPGDRQQIFRHSLSIIIGSSLFIKVRPVGLSRRAIRHAQSLELQHPFLQRLGNRPRATRHHALKQNHQEAKSAILTAQSFVVVLLRILGDGIVQLTLQRVRGTRTVHRVDIGEALFEEPLPATIYGGALARAPRDGGNLLWAEVLRLVEGKGIHQVEQVQEARRVALMGGSGQQQEDGRRLR